MLGFAQAIDENRKGNRRVLCFHIVLECNPVFKQFFFCFSLQINRDGEGRQLTPMAWSSIGPNGNFSNSNLTLNQMWLPPHPQFTTINVEKRAGMVKMASDLIHFRMDHFYIESDEDYPSILDQSNNQTEDVKILPLNMATTPLAYNNLKNNNVPVWSNVDKFNYLFHYIDGSVVVLEQCFDRKIEPIQESRNSVGEEFESPNNSPKKSDYDIKRFRYVFFTNLGSQTIVKDFSDKFRYSNILLATNVNRTRQFLMMPSLQLDPGEALIVTVE